MVPVLFKHLRESKSPNHGVLGRKYYNMNGSLVSETQMFGSLDPKVELCITVPLRGETAAEGAELTAANDG